MNNQYPSKTFLVSDFIMQVYKEVAESHGYTIVETQYEDEWEVIHIEDPEFDNTVSSSILFHEYYSHNNNDKVSYCSHDEKLLFARLDELLTPDAQAVNLQPHEYLSALYDLQSTLFALSNFVEDEEVIVEKVIQQSFSMLMEMSQIMRNTR